jgi:flagellar hook-associated protein 3 FlgL
VVSTNLSVASSALDSIRTSAQNALQNLTTWSSGTNSSFTLQNIGQGSLQDLIANADTTSNDQYVFGGINSGAAPLADYFSTPASAAKTAMDQAFFNQFGVYPTDPGAASISASQMQSFLASPAFTSLFQGASWSSNWSSASNANASVTIAPGETVANPVTANGAGFQQLAQGYAMLAEFGGSSLGEAAQQAVASAATTLVTSGLSSITAAEADVGAAQQQVTDANNQISAQSTILQTQIGSLDNVNSYQVATEVSSLTTQIQSAYDMTARLQQLNLAQYLPVV